MLDIHFLRENKDKVIENLAQRNSAGFANEIEQVLLLDEQRKKCQTLLSQSQFASKQAAEKIALAIREKQPEETIHTAKQSAQQLRQSIDVYQKELNQLEQSLREHLSKIPNFLDPLVPMGRSADDNKEVFLKEFSNDQSEITQPHWDLIKQYRLIDFEWGNKVTGAGFPFYIGKGAKLQRALVQYFLDQAVLAGYTEVIPPFMVNEDSAFGTGQLPDKEGQMYHATKDDFYLIPTAEVPVTNILRGELLAQDQLPILFAAHSPCFRREAGSWGSHVRGLNRLHQFEKVEIVRFELPENSENALEQMKKHVQHLLESLGLTYRILLLCSADTGFNSSITYDFEVLAKGQNRYLEVSSVSNFKTYQANRLKLRYKNREGQIHLLHTLNGSALALPRIMAALLENYQTKDGIMIPEVLHPYTGFTKID